MPKGSTLGISQYKDKNEYQRRWRAANPDKVAGYARDKERTRETAWRRRYGLTREEYNLMLKKQDGKCAICETTEIGRGFTHFCIDHDHSTGKIRGLLCDLCNRGLGYFKDTPEFFRRAAAYLENNNSLKDG